MNILVLNSSPKPKDFSVTQIMSRHLIDGFQEAGAWVDEYHLNQMDIRNCVDCGSCATKSQGICVINDDMTRVLFPKFIKADVLVLSTPVYFGMINAVMKKFIERLYPYLGPWQEVNEGEVLQRFRGAFPRTIVISAASWHYEQIFDQVSSYFRRLLGDKLIGELYRGSSDSFLYGAMFNEKKQSILAALKLAGIETVENGYIRDNTIQNVCQDVGELKKTVILHNLSMKLCLEENKNTMEFAQRQLSNHGKIIPKSLSSFIDTVLLSYQPDNKENLLVQIIMKGEEESCYFKISDGRLEADLGTADNPDLILQTTFAVLIDAIYIVRDIMQFILQGKILLKGNASLCEKAVSLLFSM
jgi:multimeric flavodoxin WrbA